jgi:2-polyprenyl-6-hydroxyphenyl methylase/3-demethylubiquinone-9 3-methyltransferase
VLEVGAGVGGYLAYMTRTFGYQPHGLDYSPVACERLVENFRLLGLPVRVFQRDLLHDTLADVPRFDLVYSLGLVEHFADPGPVIARHARLAKLDGLVLLGVPSFLGVNWIFLKLFRPTEFDDLNVGTMNIHAWDAFEERCGLRPLFKGYVGGWEPGLYISAGSTLREKVGNRVFGAVRRLIPPSGWYWELNSKWWSGYALALYRKVFDSP